MRLTFIGGTGRSGTSITRNFLGSAEDVATLPFEHRILIDPDGPIEFFEHLKNYRDPYKTDVAITRMFKHLRSLDSSSFYKSILDSIIRKNGFLAKKFNLSKYSGWELSQTFANYRAAVDEFECKLELSSYAAKWAGSPSYAKNNVMHYFSSADRNKFSAELFKFYSSLVANLLEARGKSHFVEDSTWNILHFNSLSEIFPRAKFVHVYRDPRDVVASFLRQRWMPNNLTQVVLIYQDLINEILEQASDSEKCYNLRFEDLVQTKEDEASKLCSFLDLDYSQAMKLFEFKNPNIGRFRSDFDFETIKYLNRTLAPQLSALDYVE